MIKGWKQAVGHSTTLQISLRELIRKRRELRSSGDRDVPTMTAVSKDIQKLIRKQNRIDKHEKIAKVLDEFKDIKRIIGIRNNNRKYVCY